MQWLTLLHEATFRTAKTNVKHLMLLILFFFNRPIVFVQITEDILYVSAVPADMRSRSCFSHQATGLPGGVSACSVTTTPGVRLITEGSKGHELCSGRGSLRGLLRTDSSSNLKGHI